MKKVFKYATGVIIPEGAIYLWSCKDMGIEHRDGKYYYNNIWHYFLVEIKDEKTN